MDLLIIRTGGTIDKIYPQSQGAYAFEFGDSPLPELLQLARVQNTFRLENPFCKDSQDITENDRRKLKQLILEAPESKILISHGTDTLIETAKYLQDIPQKTIVLFGAFQPAAMQKSDAAFQFGFALAALQNAKHGVYVAMNGRILEAENCIRNPNSGTFDKI